jgi:hypothetical protein
MPKTIAGDRYLVTYLSNPCMESTIVADVKTDNENKVVAEAIFQKCDDANANGHSFPRRVLESAIEQVKPELQDRHLLGELDHPNDINDVNRIATVELKEVSHVITDLRMDGDYVIGKFETLPTPNGMILASLLRSKVKVGVSIRAITDQDISYGMQNVDTINEFTLITYDAVHNPAYADAYVKSIVSSVKLPNNTYKIKENVRSNKLITVTPEELSTIIEATIRETSKKLKRL